LGLRELILSVLVKSVEILALLKDNFLAKSVQLSFIEVDCAKNECQHVGIGMCNNVVNFFLIGAVLGKICSTHFEEWVVNVS